MRERAMNWAGNKKGLSAQGRLRINCLNQAHSSIDRAIWFAGMTSTAKREAVESSP
jgi:aromatic-L-amino-acid/L-tryptophan decarboxylase